MLHESPYCFLVSKMYMYFTSSDYNYTFYTSKNLMNFITKIAMKNEIKELIPVKLSVYSFVQNINVNKFNHED